MNGWTRGNVNHFGWKHCIKRNPLFRVSVGWRTTVTTLSVPSRDVSLMSWETGFICLETAVQLFQLGPNWHLQKEGWLNNTFVSALVFLLDTYGKLLSGKYCKSLLNKSLSSLVWWWRKSKQFLHPIFCESLKRSKVQDPNPATSWTTSMSRYHHYLL